MAMLLSLAGTAGAPTPSSKATRRDVIMMVADVLVVVVLVVVGMVVESDLHLKVIYLEYE